MALACAVAPASCLTQNHSLHGTPLSKLIIVSKESVSSSSPFSSLTGIRGPKRVDLGQVKHLVNPDNELRHRCQHSAQSILVFISVFCFSGGAERACGELLGMQSPCPETGGAKHIADVHAADVAGVGLFSKARRTAGCGRTDDSPAPRSVPLPSERGSGSAHRAEERNALLTCVACWRKLNRWEFSGA